MKQSPPLSFLMNIEVTYPENEESIDWEYTFSDQFQDIFGNEICFKNDVHKVVKDCEVEGNIRMSTCSIYPKSTATLSDNDKESDDLHPPSEQGFIGKSKEDEAELFRKWVTRALVRLTYFFRGRGESQPYIRAFKVKSAGCSQPFTLRPIPIHGKTVHLSSTSQISTGNCNHKEESGRKGCGCLWLNGVSLGTMLNRGVFVNYYSAHKSDIESDYRIDCVFIHNELKLMVTVNQREGQVDDRKNEAHKKYQFQIKYSSIQSVLVDCSPFMDALSPDLSQIGGNERLNSADLYILMSHPPRLYEYIPVEKGSKPRSEEKEGESQSDLDVDVEDEKPTERVRLSRARTDNIGGHNKLSREVFGNSETLVLSIPTCDSIRPYTGNVNYTKLMQRSRIRFFELIARLRTLLGADRVRFTNVMQKKETPPPHYDLLACENILLPNMYNISYVLTAVCKLGYRALRKFGRTAEQRRKYIGLIEKRCKLSSKSESAADNALWMIFNALYRNGIFDIMLAFERLTNDYEQSSVVLDEELMYGNHVCMSVHKVVITPTRMILLQKETIMGNRVLRDFVEAEDAVRIQFKDDDFESLHLSEDIGQQNLVKCVVHDIMCPADNKELHIGDKNFRLLAWSNSQMKDRGFYMSCKKQDNGQVYGPRQLANELGKFKEEKENLPKVLSRMAQCLTQARATIDISKSAEARRVDDYTGGLNPESKKPYCFSDGVGLISLEKIQEVAESFLREDDEQNYVPSALQIRWAGIKGMVTADPKLDWIYGPNVHMVYRESMHKFDGDHDTLEVAKPSKPGPVSLNHRLVMILDQVSKKQSVESHERIRKAIHLQVEKQLFALADMLCSEKKAIERMDDEGVNNPMQVDYYALSQSTNTIKLTVDPFFRGQLMAIHKELLKRQADKCQIALPLRWGRNMFGVVDYTGYLMPDEVFIQISNAMDRPQTVVKSNVSRRNNITHITGRVLVLKNPCMIAGDVRMLHAVHAPPLDHLVDVIVFSRFGHRPNPDEMAGSDLDGDEYGVLFESTCPDLMLDRSELPMHFPAPEPDTTEFMLTEQQIYEFFVKSLSTVGMGQIANAHLVHADAEGLMTTDPKSRAIQDSLARKYSQALDFQKTGIPPASMSEEEKALIFPDYKCKVDKPWYKSKWILGEIFRKSNQVSILSEACRKLMQSQSEPCRPDTMLLTAGRTVYLNSAKKTRDAFFNQIQRIMDMYGIEDEAGLFCGHMDIESTRRIASGEKEDFNLYSTDVFVKKSVKRIVESFRKEFFSSLNSYEIELGQGDSATNPSEQQMDLASAWYDVTYNPEHNKTTKRSFPWIVWDVLKHTKIQKKYNLTPEERNLTKDCTEPFLEKLSKPLDSMQRSMRKYQKGRDSLCFYNTFVSALPYCSKYIKYYQPKINVVFVVFLKWGLKEGIISDLQMKVKGSDLQMKVKGDYQNPQKIDASLRPHLLLALLIDWACVNGPDDDIWGKEGLPSSTSFLRKNIDEVCTKAEIKEEISCNFERFWAEKLILGFLKYMASDYFARKDCIELNSVDGALWHKECSSLHRAAFVTYHKITLSRSFFSLIGSDYGFIEREENWDNEEGPAQRVVIDWKWHPKISEAEIEELLKKWSHVDDISVRKGYRQWNRDNPDQILYLVVGRGKPHTRHALQNLLVHSGLRHSLTQKQKPADVSDQW